MKPCIIQLSQVRAGYGANGDRPVLVNAINIRYMADQGTSRVIYFGHEKDDGGFINVKEDLDTIVELIRKEMAKL
jgi:hypothetical protein